MNTVPIQPRQVLNEFNVKWAELIKQPPEYKNDSRINVDACDDYEYLYTNRQTTDCKKYLTKLGIGV